MEGPFLKDGSLGPCSSFDYTDVAQLVRAGRLYRQGYGFDPRHQYGSVCSRDLLMMVGTNTLKKGPKEISRLVVLVDKN